MLGGSCTDSNDELNEGTIEDNLEIEKPSFLIRSEEFSEHRVEIVTDNNEGTIEENSEIEEPSFTISSEEFSEHRVEIVSGDKRNSLWLLVGDHYLCHLKTRSEQEDSAQYLWECKQRCVQKCPYKISTRVIMAGGPHQDISMDPIRWMPSKRSLEVP